MSEIERKFYQELSSYLEDGFALAKRGGNQGRGLGFVMAIFQKIAASSFAAVKRTLRRRLLMLTLHEAILRDRELDIDKRQKLVDEAKGLIREEYKLGDDPVSRSQVDRILADLKLQLVKKMDESELEMASDRYGFEFATQKAEDLAATAVSVALPEERDRIRSLLGFFSCESRDKSGKASCRLGYLMETGFIGEGRRLCNLSWHSRNVKSGDRRSIPRSGCGRPAGWRSRRKIGS